MGKLKTKKKPAKAAPETGIGGTYVYDREKGAMVRVSDRVPGVASKGKRTPEPGPSCGRGACGRGGCG